MKKNKTLLGVALLIAVLMLGVGYALLTAENFAVQGDVTVSTDQSNFVVEFTAHEDDNQTANTTTAAGTDATFSVTSLTSVGDEATATYTITNNSDVGINALMVAAQVAENTNEEYFTATAELTYEDGETDTILEVGETATLTVNVKLDKAPVTDTVTGTFTVSFTATPQAAE